VITTPTAGRGDEEGNLVAFRSDDGGRTWSPGVRVNDAPRSASEGFHDLAATEGGDLFVAWLDCRTYARGQEIWCSRSADGGRTWSKNVRAYASPEKTVCECCPIAVAAGEKGAVGVVFRNWLAGARDPYLLLSKDGGKRFASPVKLGSGTWRVAACPMMEGGGGFTGEAVVCLAGRDGRLELVRPGSWEKPLGAGIRPAVAGGPDRLFFAYREGESGPLFVGSATPGGEVEPRLLAPPGPGISRDFPAFGASRGIVALAFEEREGNASPRVGLAFLARRRGP
jgi:hypothetical protein